MQSSKSESHPPSGIKAILRKTLVLYLAATTACSNVPPEAMTPSASSVVSHGNNSAQTVEREKYKSDLPELGGSANAEKDDASRKSGYSEMEGVFPPSEQQNIADPFSESAAGYSDGSAVQSMALGALNSAATSAVKDWFSARNATAEVAFSVAERGGQSGSFDVLVPLYDSEKDLVFTQLGFRRSNTHTEDFRNTVNFGAGYRKTVDTWLLGANAFYDRDLTGKNDRLGIGAEAWTDFLKISANGYLRLSDWKKSPDLEDYLERAANGFDVRLEANLPSYPQLGGKVVYEKYYGDQVGLFGSGNRQKDPQAVTLGVTYNPVPMIGIGVDYRQGEGGVSETTGKVSLNYQFGVPLEKQLSLAYSKNHSLVNTRYDLVSRNNEIVLEYREKDAGQVMLPAQISGTPTLTLTFPMTVTDKTIGSFTWVGTAAAFALPYGGGPSASVVLPAYADGGNNSYTLQAIGSDRFNRAIQSNVMQIQVTPFQMQLERSKATVMADGSDSVMFTALLQEPTGEAKANTPVVWDVQGNATIEEKDERTDGKGNARLALSSRFASAVRVSVQEPQGAKAVSEAAFAGDITTARVLELVASPQTLVAGGKTTSTLKATLVDANNNPVGPGAIVKWQTTAGELSSKQTTTGDDSTTTVVLTSGLVVGTASVTAQAVKGSASAPVEFVADNASARVRTLTATPSTLPADGKASSTLVATVEDSNGNLVGPNVAVTWTTTAGVLSAQTSVTNGQSQASVALKSPVAAGTGTVTAKAAAGSENVAVSFQPDSTTAKVIEVEATPATIKANGIDASQLVATVEDASGNPVAGATVTWTTTTGQLSASSTTTDAQGKARASLKGTAAGAATVKASAVAGASTASVDLLPDGTTAKVIDLEATPATIKANGTDASQLVATVEDASGNPVAGA
ncbi:inverse autotransporter beta domain-containing protein, partial [Pseudomonas fluorescens]|uniref:inverse autotransporter beta domain-containing protein n=1 Tax=Pseudomonas fluorescens TaxID=294 RepID=UPI00177F906B